MGTENAFIPFTRLVADRSDSAGGFNGNVVLHKTSTEIVIKLILACVPKLKKKKMKIEKWFLLDEDSTCRDRT